MSSKLHVKFDCDIKFRVSIFFQILFTYSENKPKKNRKINFRMPRNFDLHKSILQFHPRNEQRLFTMYTVDNNSHNILLMDSSVDTDRYINRQNIPKTVYVLESANENITGFKILTEIKSKNTLMIAALGKYNFNSNSNFLHLIVTIQRLQINMKIGWFFPHSATSDDLHEFFAWCKKHLIINIFAAVQRASPDALPNIFRYNFYGNFDVINVTDSKTYKSYFPNANFQQHQLKLGQPFHFNFNEQLWRTIFTVMNATYIIVQNNYTILSGLYENGIDIIPRLFI